MNDQTKKIVFWAFLLLLFVGFLEISSLILLKDIDNFPFRPNAISENHVKILNNLLEEKNRYFRHDPVLGWEVKPYGVSKLYSANSQGARGKKEYSSIPAKDKIRVSAFGDSFTHCDDVKNEETWQEQLNLVDPGLEVLNFGVPGYGLDQAFLRYKKLGKEFNPHIVLIGFMPENINRVVNVFRPFYKEITGIPLAKPRYMINANQLDLLSNPLPKLSDYASFLKRPGPTLSALGVHDYHYQLRGERGLIDFFPSVRLLKILNVKHIKNNIVKNGYYNTESEAYRVTARLFDEFYQAVIKNNSIPVILVFPNKKDLQKYRWTNKKIIEPLLAHFKSRGYRYVDLLDAFDQFGRDQAIKELCPRHYTPLGNVVVAKYLASYIPKVFRGRN